jgi:hypothetical protein
MNKQHRTSTTSQTTMFRDLRTRNERRDRIAKLLDSQRQRRIERGREAQLEHWARRK